MAERRSAILRWSGLLAMGVVLWGCASSGPTAQPSGQSHLPAQEAAALNDGFRPAAVEGSLFNDQAALGNLFVNPKARRVGDLVTIRIVETSSAANQASTTTDRTSSLSAGMQGFFNAERRYADNHPFFNPFSSVRGSINSEFEGTGETKRSGALTAFMTARIVDIMPNGNLFIEGNREVRVNNENQTMTLTGIIRSRDISSDNVIRSTYIADARIAYSGKGVLNERQRPGWLARIFDVIWPF
jgi:flagellar L-ring protein FlgH